MAGGGGDKVTYVETARILRPGCDLSEIQQHELAPLGSFTMRIGLDRAPRLSRKVPARARDGNHARPAQSLRAGGDALAFYSAPRRFSSAGGELVGGAAEGAGPDSGEGAPIERGSDRAGPEETAGGARPTVGWFSSSLLKHHPETAIVGVFWIESWIL
jgi:hypothetical protein